MSERAAGLLIEDICEAIEKIGRYVAGMTRETFLSDEKTSDAVARNLEIIGEAANRLPENIKTKYPDIPWRKITGLRHRIVHEYFDVDLEIVWKIVRDDLPAFKALLWPVRAELARRNPDRPKTC
ncbi:MAG: DUF86 domain-containing protein [Nitrospinae bacterium]|nr:DUF86 domain-containing protein [Nitrospinota bacterium]